MFILYIIILYISGNVNNIFRHFHLFAAIMHNALLTFISFSAILQTEVDNMPKQSSGHTFEAFFKRATSPLVVLKLLMEGSKYGYEITQELKKRSDGRYKIAILYPILYRLIEQGYIVEDKTEVVDGRARNYYSITDEGRAYFDKTLKEYYIISDAFSELMGGRPDE